MADIKTRDAVTGTIKSIDKSAVAAERMKDAFIRTKDDAQRGASSAEDSPEEYAADQVAFYIDGQFIKSWAEGFTDDEMYLMLNCWYPKWLDGKSVNEAQYLIVEWIKY